MSSSSTRTVSPGVTLGILPTGARSDMCWIPVPPIPGTIGRDQVIDTLFLAFSGGNSCVTPLRTKAFPKGMGADAGNAREHFRVALGEQLDDQDSNFLLVEETLRNVLNAAFEQLEGARHFADAELRWFFKIILGLTCQESMLWEHTLGTRGRRGQVRRQRPTLLSMSDIRITGT